MSTLQMTAAEAGSSTGQLMTMPARGVSSPSVPVPSSTCWRRNGGECILDPSVLTEVIVAGGADGHGADLGRSYLPGRHQRPQMQRVDGRALPFETEFDAAFTNCGALLDAWARARDRGRGARAQASRPFRGRVRRFWQ